MVALKAGRTPAGAAAARSHTGALASEDRVVDAFFERHGIWRARDVDDLVRTVDLHLRPWRPRGRRAVVMSNSGASCVQCADAAEGWGLELTPLAPATVEALDAVLPSFATTTNPIDLTTALIGNAGLFTNVLTPLAADQSVDGFHLALPIAGRGYDLETIAADLHEVARHRPVVVSCPMPERITAPFVAQGLPLFPTETEAIAALGSYFGQRARQAEASRRDPPVTTVSARPLGRMLDEAASLALVGQLGLPVVQHRLCRTPGEAVEAFDALGGAPGSPVVLKGCSAAVSHKSELGLVRLGLVSTDAVIEAFVAILAELSGVGEPASGVIVARQAVGRRELLLGARHDPTFGTVVVVGDGGVYVEAMPDVAVLVHPLSVPDVLGALEGFGSPRCWGAPGASRRWTRSPTRRLQSPWAGSSTTRRLGS